MTILCIAKQTYYSESTSPSSLKVLSGVPGAFSVIHDVAEAPYYVAAIADGLYYVTGTPGGGESGNYTTTDFAVFTPYAGDLPPPPADHAEYGVVTGTPNPWSAGCSFTSSGLDYLFDYSDDVLYRSVSGELTQVGSTTLPPYDVGAHNVFQNAVASGFFYTVAAVESVKKVIAIDVATGAVTEVADLGDYYSNALLCASGPAVPAPSNPVFWTRNVKTYETP